MFKVDPTGVHEAVEGGKERRCDPIDGKAQTGQRSLPHKLQTAAPISPPNRRTAYIAPPKISILAIAPEARVHMREHVAPGNAARALAGLP